MNLAVGRQLAIRIAIVAALLALAPAASAQYGASDGEWRSYAGDAGSTKYSPLDQINAENVKDLKVLWRWKTDNFGPRTHFNYEVTPLMIGGVLYTTAGSRRTVVAIDAATGETLWIFRPDEGMRVGAAGRGGAGRGVAYWSDGEEARIFIVTRGFQLIALDPETGNKIPGFGENGAVDLKHGLDRPVARGIGSTSPPVIVNDVVVVGSSFPAASTTKQTPPGHVRGYDPRTGRRLWIFHTIPQNDEFGVETWEDDAWTYTGNAGVWTLLTADEELGYVYLPIETSANDWYGGHRLGDNLFAESLVCLDAETGRRVWHFQLVHHGIFDYDIPAAPVLCDITVQGRRIKAVAQITKQGFCFVFDRATGEPVWPIEEREVPPSDVPGERASPTQPFPTKPPPFARQGVTVDDLLDFTPELRAEALEIASHYRLGPLYTPPSLIEDEVTSGTIQLPGSRGGANWPGAAVDPETGILYVSSSTVPQVIALNKPDPNRSNFNYIRVGSMTIRGPRGLPLLKPPWGRITAIDLNRGEHLWQVANGETPEHIRNHPALRDVELGPTGQPGRGGPLVTKTLLFVGEGGGLYNSARGAGGPILRAYDKMTGEVLAEIELPANQTGVPMTYMLDDKQYIVVAVGARRHPGELVALRLP